MVILVHHFSSPVSSCYIAGLGRAQAIRKHREIFEQRRLLRASHALERAFVLEPASGHETHDILIRTHFPSHRRLRQSGKRHRTRRFGKHAFFLRQALLPVQHGFILHNITLPAQSPAGRNHLVAIQHAADLQTADVRLRVDGDRPIRARAQR